MQLDDEDLTQFFRVHQTLMFFVGQRLEVIDSKVETPRAYAGLSPETRSKVHRAFVEHLELIDEYVDQNPFHLDAADLDIARGWKHRVTGEFFAFRQQRNQLLFLTISEPVVVYGVLALFNSFEEIIGPELPRMVETTLLPFKGRIVYDGLISMKSVVFGGGFKRGLNESYKEAKARSGIVTSLPHSTEDPPVPPTRTPSRRATTAKPSGAAAKAKSSHDQIMALVDAYCRDQLDEEYAVLCRKLAGILARKRPSPLSSGKPESWASGIVRVVGWLNFIGDPSQPHHRKMVDIDHAFGVSEATGSAKATAIRKLLDLAGFEPEWTLPSRLSQNPMAWMVEVNGMILDARSMPRAFQEQAFQHGLIPYVPADRIDKPPKN